MSRGTAMVCRAAHNFPAPPRMLFLPLTFPTCPRPDAASQPRDLPSKKTDTHSLTPALVSPASCLLPPVSPPHAALDPGRPATLTTLPQSPRPAHTLRLRRTHTLTQHDTLDHPAQPCTASPRYRAAPRRAATLYADHGPASPCPSHHQPRPGPATRHQPSATTTPSPASHQAGVTQALTYQPPPARQQHHAPRCRLATLYRPQPCTQPLPASQAGVHASSTSPAQRDHHAQQCAC